MDAVRLLRDLHPVLNPASSNFIYFGQHSLFTDKVRPINMLGSSVYNDLRSCAALLEAPATWHHSLVARQARNHQEPTTARTRA